MVSDLISFNIVMVLSINSCNVFAVRDFKVHHKNRPIYFGETDRLGETWCSPTLLDLFIPSDASICSAMAFPPLGNLIMWLFQFPLTFRQKTGCSISSNNL